MKLLFFLFASLDWSKPVEIAVDDAVCATYDARVLGDRLAVRVRLAKGWHTFAMDNTIRANEKLAGKKALGQDRPTSFVISDGLEAAGPWLQSAPRDFSKPELRIFTWGFEEEAVFVVPVKRTGPAKSARIAIKAQACTEAICKNIDTALEVALPETDLVPVRVN